MASVHGAVRQFRGLPSEVAARAARSSLLRGILEGRYRAALASHAPRLPQLDGVEAAIVDGLRRHGFATASVWSLGLPDAAALLQQARRVHSEQAGAFAAAIARGTQYLIADPTAMARRPKLYRFGLDERLLDIVEAYVGLPVGYDGVVLQYSPADGRAAATRAWHRDREDRAVVKIGLYLNDVGPADGPFELLPDPEAQDGRNRDPLACTGAAGTIFFADTARYLHRGRPITGKPRLALFYSYFARRPRDPWYCVRTGTSRAQLRTLTAGLSPRQRAAALWRRDLPWLARLVPPAPL